MSELVTGGVPSDGPSSPASDVVPYETDGVVRRALRWVPRSAARPGAPVVLLHGFSQAPGSWGEVAPLLAESLGREVWAPEYVGQGDGAGPVPDGSSYSFDALVGAVAGFCRTCGTPVSLVGYSMGGRVALGVARRHPEALASLVLESAGLGPAGSEEQAAAARADAEVSRRLRSEPLARFMDWWEERPVFASQRGLPPDRRALLRAGRMANDPVKLALVVEGAGKHAMPDLSGVPGELAARGVPTLYLAGELDPKYAGVARALAGEGVCARVLPGVGHDVHFEDAGLFCATVAAWLSGSASGRPA